MLWLAIGVGGAIGSIARYALSLALTTRVGSSLPFPIGTLTVNAVGCFAAGILLGAVARAAISEELRAFVMAGLLGGFTTFSAFGVELFSMLKNGEVAGALAYISLSVVIALVGVWAGFAVSS